MIQNISKKLKKNNFTKRNSTFGRGSGVGKISGFLSSSSKLKMFPFEK
jgi:hypothetical protein